MDNNLRIAWMFPDTLYLHGERGNVLALEKIGKDLGLEIIVDKINLEDNFNPKDYDILYFGAGELNRTESIVNKLKEVNEDLSDFVNKGKPIIVTGNSVSYFGKKIQGVHSTFNGLGLIDIITKEKDAVYGDDLYFKTRYNNKDLEIFGSQIQMTDIIPGKEKSFGKLLYGYGNSGDTLNEGVIKGNSIFTNTLGPLLILNPWLTKEILTVAANNKNIEIENKDLDFSIEKESLNSKINFTKNKKTDLKNCDLSKL